MNQKINKNYREIGYEAEQDLSNTSTADATGLCFAAAVVCAFVAAGVIVYQTGNSDVVTASNDAMPAAAQAGPLDAAAIVPQR